jgi:hypothetical protein
MRRRDFVALIGGAAASWPLLAGAGESSVPRRVGVLMNLAADDAMGGRRLTAFRQALQQLGWTDGSKLPQGFSVDAAGETIKSRSAHLPRTAQARPKR